MSGAIGLNPLHAFKTWTGTTLPLPNHPTTRVDVPSVTDRSVVKQNKNKLFAKILNTATSFGDIKVL